MFTKAVNTCKNAAHSVATGIKGACDKIYSTCNYFGRTVSRITSEHVFKPGRQFVKENGDSIPYTIGLTPFALIGIGPLAAGVSLLAIGILQNQSNIKTCAHAYQGIRNFCVLGGAIDSVRSIATLNPFFLINLPFYLLIGALAHEKHERALARAF
jgi:hypothetical protein